MSKLFAIGAAASLGAGVRSYFSANEKAAECAAFSTSGFTTKYSSYPLGEIINLAEDVAIFRFLLDKPSDEFSLVPCSTLQAHFKEGTNIVDQPMRFYTPITPNGTKGYFDLLIKKQRPGRFTEFLFGMDIGDPLLFRVVQYKLEYRKDRWKHAGMIAGGTGICPILQFMDAALSIPGDKTKISLLFANRSENKILLKGMLDEKAAAFKDRLQVFYVVDRIEDPDTIPNPAYKIGRPLNIDRYAQPDTSPDGKKYFHGFEGHTSIAMINATMPPPSSDNIILVCGPDGMMTKVCGSPPAVLKAMSGGLAYQPAGALLNNLSDVRGYLGHLGYTKEMLYRF